MVMNILITLYHLTGGCSNPVCNMAVVYLTVGCIALLTGIQGVIITEPSEKTLVVAYGQEVILWCNFSYAATENGNTRIEAQLNLNGTSPNENVYMYEQNGGGGGNDISPHLLNHFQSRTDIEELREPLAIGLKIKQAQWDDSGNYTWTMVVDRSQATAHSNVHTNDLIVGWKPTSADLQYSQIGNTTYNITCNTSGGKPVPDVTIFKNANAIQTLVSDVPVSVTLNITSESVFYCAATNQLGSVNSSWVLLAERPTTTEIATSPFTSTPDYSGVTQGPVSTETTDSSTNGPTTPTPQPLEVHYIIIIAVSGCCVVVIVIIAVVCIHKHSANKRQANPDKGNTTGAQTENQYDEMPMDSSKYQQEQEEKQQRNIEGLQYADLDLRPTGKTKPAGGNGGNKLVFNDDSHVEYAEVRKM